MRTITIVCLILIQCFKLYSQQTFNTKYGSPIIALIEGNPWLMVIGSDVPTFVLYENGQIIYQKEIKRDVKFFEIELNKDEVQNLIKTFGITDSLIKNHPDYVEASGATDQSENVLILNLDTLREIRIYGSLRNKKDDDRKRVSKHFLTVHDNLITYKNDKAKEWIPDFFEIMLTDYSNSPVIPAKWSKDWADLTDPKTVKRSETLHSIYLDKKYYHEFIKFVNNLKEKQAVEINGKKYFVSIRFPFPNMR